MIERILKVADLHPHELKQAEFETLNFDYLTAAIYKTQRITPLVVSVREDGRQVVLAGHHRLKAMKKLDIKTVSCQVFEGLTSEQEMKHFHLDNVRGQIKDGDKQLEIALEILELMPHASTKEKMAEFSKKTGVSMDSAKKSVSAAKKIKATIDTADDKESATKEAMKQAKNGLRSKKPTAKIVPDSLPVTAEVVTCPHCAELEEELAKYKRHIAFIVESFPEGEWRDLVASLDQPIDLSQIKSHIAKPDGFKMALKVNTTDPPKSLHKLFDLSFNGQPIATD